MELMDTTNLQSQNAVELNTNYRGLAYDENTSNKTTIGLGQRSLHTRGKENEKGLLISVGEKIGTLFSIPLLNPAILRQRKNTVKKVTKVATGLVN